MKKSILIVGIIIALIASVTIPYAYATEETDSFFEVSSTEVSKTESIEMTINIDNISYNSFTFKLSSDVDIENIETEDEDVNVEVDETSNEITIQIDKTTDNISEIKLYYDIPDSVEVGDTIKLVAVIINDENEEETETIEQEITIVEESEEETDSNDDTQSDSNNRNQNISSNGNQQQQSMTQNQNSTDMSEGGKSQTMTSETSMSTGTTSGGSNSKDTVTYNGSSNNYLSSLSVKGYSLDKEFAKENSTYFITVDDDVETIKVTAEAEDDDATVCIYGNEDLESGTNKVLISVTSEDGSVRTYRIFVTKE